MSSAFQSPPLTLGLFEKRIEGDDSLMELARRRFHAAGMGAEMHAATPEQLEGVLQFRPAGDAPVVVHLARNLNLAEPDSRRQIEDFARRFAGRVHGLVIHDHRDLAIRPQDFLQAAREMNARLLRIKTCPWLFVEYAAGLELETFVKFFAAIFALDRISVCVDIGHVGIHAARKAYANRHPGTDICTLKAQPDRVPALMPEVEDALKTALPAVLGLVEDLGACGKPAHFHLHDGHPLSTASPFGVSDHLSFAAEIPLGFKYQGRARTELMFGRTGLFQIIAKAIRIFGGERVSFTLEIHPTADRLPLGDAAALFDHWWDKTNAEKMNRWLSVLAENHRVLRQAISRALATERPPGEEALAILKG